MNCLEFRRRCIAEPSCRDSGYLKHKAECEHCYALSVEMEKFDEKLDSATRVEAPSDLASRVLLKQSMLLDKSRRRFNYGLYVMAASVLIIIGITVGLVSNQKPTLDQAVIAYVTHQLQNRQTVADVNNEQLKQLFQSVGLQLNDGFGKINLAERCYVRDTESLHIVLQGKHGPVTVLVMPHNKLDKPTNVSNNYFTGIITPCPRGSMAILGSPGEELESIKQTIVKQVLWL